MNAIVHSGSAVKVWLARSVAVFGLIIAMTAGLLTVTAAAAAASVGVAPAANEAAVVQAPATRWSTDFSGDTVGAAPAGWTSRWAEASNFVIADNPRRAVLTVTGTSDARNLWTFDEPGVLSDNAEIAGLVRVPAPMPSSKFQAHLFASGTAADSTVSYYLDHSGSNSRLNRYSANNGFTNLRTAALTLTADTWYNVVVRRDNFAGAFALYGKVWPFGTAEPTAWTLTNTSGTLTSGRVGIGHFAANAVNDWAYFAAATGGENADRAPADIFDTPAVAPVVEAQLNPAAPTGSAGWWTGPVTLTLSATPSADLEYRTADGVWTAYSAPVTLDHQGTTVVEYRGTAGGVTSAVGSVTVKIDSIAPVTTAAVSGQPGPGAGEYASPAELSLTAVDDTSGTALVEYRIGEEPWQTYSSAVTFADPGDYEIEYRSADAAGNIEAARSIVFTVLESDTPPPGDEDQWSTDFSEDTAGSAPQGWTSRWASGSSLVVNDNPRRATLTMPVAGARTLWTYDEPGVLSGASEISGVFRTAAPLPATKFQAHLFANGSLTANTNASYYMDHNGSNVRIARGSPNGGFTSLRTLAFTFAADTWYNMVLRREEPNLLYGKIWAYGQAEPDQWMMSTTSAELTSGWAGIGHVTGDAVNDWAFFGAGTAGKSAPRAPAGLFNDVVPPPAPDAPSGVTVVQNQGFATVAWEPITPAAGAGNVTYQVWRTPVNASDVATGTAVLVGNWLPGRTPTNVTTWADAGFTIGQRYSWKVRAVVGGVQSAFSAGVSGLTRGADGPDDRRTPWEDSGGLTWTSGADEETYLKAIDAATDRVRVEQYGTTVQGRPMYVAVIGNPAPAAAEVAGRNPALVSCTVHGNEPAGREACLLLVRELAFSTDPATIELLQTSTVLVVPTMNPDGRAANIRANANGQDLNRDHALLEQPESLAFAKLLRDYQPISLVDGHEYGTSTASDLPILWPRNPNVDEQLYLAAQNGLVLGAVSDAAAANGWWASPYPIGYGGEGILRNATGLKNIYSMLLESRLPAGATRPSEGASTTNTNRQRRVYSQLFTFQQLLDHHRANFTQLVALTDGAAARQTANTGPISLDGARPSPVGSPPAEAVTKVLDPAPCGYSLTNAQLASGTPTVGARLEAHGFVMEAIEGGQLIKLAQPNRGLIPLVLDPEAVENMVAATRVMTNCEDVVVEPEPDPAQYSTDFGQDTAGQPPAGWTSQWSAGNLFVVNDNPRRVTHQPAVNLAREGYRYDEVGSVQGDVEVSAVVRTLAPLPNTKFQVHIAGGGGAASTTSYYLDHLGGNVRISRYGPGAVSNLVTAPFVYEANTWYNIVFAKQGDWLRGKIWAYGTPEPTAWMVEIQDTVLSGGWVGFGHSTVAATQEFAYYSAGTLGKTAPRAPDDLFGEPPTPVLTAMITPQTPESGWHTTDVLVAITSDLPSTAIEYKLDGGSWTAYTGAVTVTTDGVHTLSYRGTAGTKSSETGMVTIKKDSVAPVTSATTSTTEVAGGGYPFGVTVSLAAIDATSTVSATSYRIDEGEWQDYQGPITVGPVGQHVIEYRSVDVAGNVEQTRQLTVTVVKSASSTVVSAEIGGQGVVKTPVGREVDLVATVTVGGSPAASGRVAFDVDGVALGSAEVTAGRAVWTTSGLTLGGHTVNAEFVGTDTAKASEGSFDLDVHFVDVSGGLFYEDIQWLAEQGLSNGFSGGYFRPSAGVARDAMAAFLYRLVEGPGTAPACAVKPFADISVKSPFCGEIQWMKQQKLANGYADGTYRPSTAVDRQTFAAFLFRLEYGAAAGGARCSTAPFNDVTVKHPFCPAISWMLTREVSSGFPGNLFKPNASLERQALAAWLHRYADLAN